MTAIRNKQFRRIIDDYVAMVQGKFTEADQLPSQSDEVSVMTSGSRLKACWIQANDVAKHSE